MNDQDHQLNRQLRQWRDIQAPGNFEANVWRQIRLAHNPQAAGRLPLGECLQRWLWHPAGVLTMAALVGLGAGIWGGISATPRPASDTAFLSIGTLSGSYGRMVTGGGR